MDFKVLLLAGDGIGPEVMDSSVALLSALAKQGLNVHTENALIGGAAIDETGVPLPEETLKLAKQSHAVLLAAVGGAKWDNLPLEKRPEAGLLGIRAGLNLFANLRPVQYFPQLENASSLKPEFIRNLDLLILRELTGGVYFGKPRGRSVKKNIREAVNTMVYDEREIERIVKLGFDYARKRRRKLTSVDKSNVLEVSQLWREVTNEVGKNYPDVELNHLYVDNCAMQLVINPRQFDVIVTENLFGDILSDEASILTGSIGMLPSASLGSGNQICRGLFEPVHGSAPDIAGKDLANPLAMFLSLALLLKTAHPDPLLGGRYSEIVLAAIHRVLDQGYRTRDLAAKEASKKEKTVGTREMTRLVIGALKGT